MTKIEFAHFPSSIAGVSHENPNGQPRQRIIADHCYPGQQLYLVREPENPYGKTAVGIWIDAYDQKKWCKLQIGYLSSEVSREIAPRMDRGEPVYARIKETTGGVKGKETIGVNIEIVYRKI